MNLAWMEAETRDAPASDAPRYELASPAAQPRASARARTTQVPKSPASTAAARETERLNAQVAAELASAAGDTVGPARQLEPLAEAAPFGEDCHARSEGGASSPAVQGAGVGEAGAAVTPSPAARAPGLRSLRNPCTGYFPGTADADQGEVQVVVEVDATGHTRRSSVLLERPLGQGFAQAAHACARALLFEPARDGAGAAVPGQTKLKLRFQRT